MVLIRQALSGRLGEVRHLVHAAAPAAAARAATPQGGPPRPEQGAAAAASDPEESLRRLMVSVLPSVRDRPGPGPDRAHLFTLLSDLEGSARSEDLRFLDAWNSACEVVLTWPREELARDDARAMLLAYTSLLETHLQRLGGRS